MKCITKFIVAALLLFPALSFAHNGEMHGKPVEGTVSSIEKDSLMLSTSEGDKKVSLHESTVYVGEKEEKLAKTDLKQGGFLMVYGTTLETGEVVAKEVMIHGVSDSHSGHH